MFLIGLTGGIASGKSTVCKMIAELGITVVDADVIAREVVEIGTPAYKRIREEFGDAVFKQSGELDRGKLGALIFTDDSKRRLINSITHPAIYKRMRWQVLCHFFSGEQMIVLDMPLLFETGKALPFIYKTIVVNCEGKEQQLRLQERGGYTELQAKDRIAAQMPLEVKTEKADYVIENTGIRCETREQVDAIFRTLRESNHHYANKLLVYSVAALILALIIVGGYSLLGVIARRSGVV